MLGTRVVIKEFFPKNIAARTNGTVGPREDVAPYMYENRLESFCSEAKLLSSLAGTPGVLSIKDAFRSNGTAYIVTEYFEGKTLAKYLDENGGRLGWNDTASILSPVSKALKILHDKGIIHKDVSPSNILVTHNGGMLIDYGSVVSSERTLKHGYAPLELYSSNIPASAATDIYALAATAYKCLTGITPAQATDRIIEDTLQKPSKSGSDITRTAEGYLMQALAIRPGERNISDDGMIKLFGIRRSTPAAAQVTDALYSPIRTQAPTQEKTSALPETSEEHSTSSL